YRWPRNGHDQRARPEMLVIIEAIVGRAPLDWVLCLPRSYQTPPHREAYSVGSNQVISELRPLSTDTTVHFTSLASLGFFNRTCALTRGRLVQRGVRPGGAGAKPP